VKERHMDKRRIYLNAAKKFPPEITPALPSPLEGEG